MDPVKWNEQLCHTSTYAGAALSEVTGILWAAFQVGCVAFPPIKHSFSCPREIRNMSDFEARCSDTVMLWGFFFLA